MTQAYLESAGFATPDPAPDPIELSVDPGRLRLCVGQLRPQGVLPSDPRLPPSPVEGYEPVNPSHRGSGERLRLSPESRSVRVRGVHTRCRERSRPYPATADLIDI